MFSKKIQALATSVITSLNKQKKTIITVESCTGGLVAAALTSISGSSSVVFGGFVTYANEAKNQMAGVPMALIDEYGAVSEQVAIAMAKGALANTSAGIAISITGIAGPTGGTKEKPVGLVHFALAMGDNVFHSKELFGIDKSREFIREASVLRALKLVLEQLQ